MEEQAAEDVQPENEANEAEVNLDDYKLDPRVAVNRFIWIFDLEPSYTSNADKFLLAPEYKDAFTMVRAADIYLKMLADKEPKAVVDLLLKAAKSSCLPSSEGSTFFVAWCLRQPDLAALNIELRKCFELLIPDLPIFCYYYYNFVNMENKKLSFNSGMRKCLERWYDKKSPAELLELIYAAPKVREFGHKKIIQMLSPKFENPDKNEVVSTVFMNDEKLTELAKTSSTAKKILDYKKLKACLKNDQVMAILRRREFNYKFHHLPTFAGKFSDIVEIMLPNLSLNEVIDNLPLFARNGRLLKESISRKISYTLQASNKTISEAKLNPVKVLRVIKQIDLLNVTKEDKKSPKTVIVQKLKHIMTQCLGDQPKTGCRFFVTIDMRKFSQRQEKVYGMKDVKCAELQTLVALMLLKTEKDVIMMSFSDDKHKLKPVQWTSETSFEEAMEIYEKETNETPKTKQYIILPLRKASEDKKKIDVFITFVSSIARSMGKISHAPYKELNKYRKALNLKMARMIVVNMTRKTHDFKVDDDVVNEKGILELVGFEPESLKVIEGFSRNCFT